LRTAYTGFDGGTRMIAAARLDRLASHVDRRLAWACAALVVVDVMFIAVYSIHAIYVPLYNEDAPLLGWRWDIRMDWSYAEIFGYLKILAIVALLISIPRVWKRPIYLAFIAIFTFMLLDDSLELHETWGFFIAETLGLPPLGRLRPIDPGELLVWTLAGIPLLGAAVAAVLRSPREDRGNGFLLMAALSVLALFAVVADMAHIVLRWAFRGADDLFAVIEDGGEQITLSLTSGLTALIRRDVRSRERRIGSA
jgi:hypothetical protein